MNFVSALYTKVTHTLGLQLEVPVASESAGTDSDQREPPQSASNRTHARLAGIAVAQEECELVPLPVPDLDSQLFASSRAFQRFINRFCRGQLQDNAQPMFAGYAMCIRRSRRNQSVIRFICSRGRYPTRNENQGRYRQRQRKSSLYCGCQFAIEGAVVPGEAGRPLRFAVTHAQHNHQGLASLADHPTLRVPDNDELAEAGLTPEAILAMPPVAAKFAIRAATHCPVTIADVHNIRKRLTRRLQDANFAV